MNNTPLDVINQEQIAEANRRHDLEHGNPHHYMLSKTRSGWNTPQMSIKGKLTDKAIEKYSKKGFYSEEFRDARRLFQAKKNGQRKREGNFDIVEGRLVYRP